MPAWPGQVLALRGVDGTVQLGPEAVHTGFLRDASSWVEADQIHSFSVPFHVAALEVLARCCRAQQQQIGQGKYAMVVPPLGDMSTFVRYLDTLQPELLVEVFRMANFLDCERLLTLACQAIARVLKAASRDPEVLAGFIYPPASGTGAPILPWSSQWKLAIDEPIFERPTTPIAALADQHALADEDALTLCLLECDAAALRALKGLSSEWSERARTILCDDGWRAAQAHLSLDWALSIEVRVRLEAEV